MKKNIFISLAEMNLMDRVRAEQEELFNDDTFNMALKEFRLIEHSDYTLEHIVKETTNRDEYISQITEQLKNAKTIVGNYEVEFIGVESFSKAVFCKGDKIILHFKIKKYEKQKSGMEMFDKILKEEISKLL